MISFAVFCKYQKPKNGGLEDVVPFQKGDLQFCRFVAVSFR